jgi:hypothetical protein
MKRLSGPRKTASLSTSLHQRLNTYALAASAAGVGILALAQPALGEIIHTHMHKAIGRQGVIIDFNHDGIGDFKIQPVTFPSDTLAMLAISQKANRVFGATIQNFPGIGASQLPAGYPIGRKNDGKFKFGEPFSTARGETTGTAKVLYFCGFYSNCHGPWSTATGGYLGFKFLIKGKVHYGWARLTGFRLQFGSWFLEGYAYETIPNKPIKAGATKGNGDERIDGPDALLVAPAPKPATLGALATGASGLSSWRQKESVSVAGSLSK